MSHSELSYLQMNMQLLMNHTQFLLTKHQDPHPLKFKPRHIGFSDPIAAPQWFLLLLLSPKLACSDVLNLSANFRPSVSLDPSWLRV